MEYEVVDVTTLEIPNGGDGPQSDRGDQNGICILIRCILHLTRSTSISGVRKLQ
jgi:hypothetical protein